MAMNHFDMMAHDALLDARDGSSAHTERSTVRAGGLLTEPLSDLRCLKLAGYALNRLQFALYGVRHGHGLRARGVQILNRGTITLGNNVSMASRQQGTPYITSLRTYFPESRIQLGNGIFLSGTVIHANQLVTMGDHAGTGPGVVIMDNDSHAPILTRGGPRHERPPQEPVHIGARVWLGMRVIVMKGVTIGDDTIVAAGSIVTRSLPAGVLAAGAPAKPIRELTERVDLPGPRFT
jgi:acetyltransferase-like isoleucine patch superfamily enzyme